MKRTGNGLKLGIGLFISAVCMYLAFRPVELPKMVYAFREANYLFLVPALVVLFLSHWLRAWRWRYLLEPIKRIDLGSLFSSLMIGYMANLFLPAHLGEIVRAYVVGKKRAIPVSSAFATIVIERIIDVLSLLVLMVLTLMFYPFPDWVKKSGYIMFFATVGLFLFLLLLKKNSVITFRLLHTILKPFSENFYSKLQNVLQSFLNGLVGLKDWKHYLIIAVLSAVIWACYGGIFFIGFYAFNFESYHLPWIAAPVVLVITTVSVVVPSSPGYVGTYHWLCQLALDLFGVPKSPALAFAFLAHGLNFIPIIIVGLGFSWKEGLTLSKMRQQRPLQEALVE